MAFRGIGDDAMRVMREQEQERLEQERINEQRRANIANEMLRNKELNIRQKESAADRKFKAQQQTSAFQFQEKLENRRNELTERQLQAQQDEVARKAALEERRQQQADDLYERSKKEWDSIQEQRDAERKMAESALAVGIRTALFEGAAPENMITAINESRGIANGQPGALTKLYDYRDPENPLYSYGLVATSMGQNGKEVMEMITPAMVQQSLGSFTTATRDEVLKNYLSVTTGVNSPMTLMMKHSQKMAQEQLKQEGLIERTRIRTEAGKATGASELTTINKSIEAINTALTSVRNLPTGTPGKDQLVTQLTDSLGALSVRAGTEAANVAQVSPEEKYRQRQKEMENLYNQFTTGWAEYQKQRDLVKELEEEAKTEPSKEASLRHEEAENKLASMSLALNRLQKEMTEHKDPPPASFEDIKPSEIDAATVSRSSDNRSVFKKRAVRTTVPNKQGEYQVRMVQTQVDGVQSDGKTPNITIVIDDPAPGGKGAGTQQRIPVVTTGKDTALINKYKAVRKYLGDETVDYLLKATMRQWEELEAKSEEAYIATKKKTIENRKSNQGAIKSMSTLPATMAPSAAR